MIITLNSVKRLVYMFMIIWSLDIVVYNIGQTHHFGDRICFLLQMWKCWVAPTNVALVFSQYT